MAKEETNSGPLDFADLIRDLGHGATNKQASKLVAETISACAATGGKGKIVMTITIGAGDGLAELAASVKATLPQPKLPAGTYYTTKTGELVTEDPRQTTFGAKVLAMPSVKRNPDDGGNLS